MSVLGGMLTLTPSRIFQPLAPAGFRKCQPVRSLPLNREIQFCFFAWADCSNVIDAQSTTTIRKPLLTVITFRINNNASKTADELSHTDCKDPQRFGQRVSS